MTTLQRLTTFAVLALGVLLLASAKPAEAGLGWSVGGHFSVGHVDFNVYYRAGHHDHYYYRTRQPIRYHGVGCGDACYLRGGHTYHHASCPLVDFHFRRYGFHPARVLDPIFYPRGYRYPEYRYRSYGYPPYRGYSYRSYPYRSHPRHYRPHGHGHHKNRHQRPYGHYPRYRYDRDWDSDWDSDSDSDRHRRRRRY